MLVRILRDPDIGCRWDREQTHESVRHNFVEEAYEVVDAIDCKDADMLCEELGDVLLQVCLHTEMEYELQHFYFYNLCYCICNKIFFRHPNFFSDNDADSTEQILKNWEELKKQEKSHKSLDDIVDGITKSLPALMYTKKLQKALSYGIGPEQTLENVKKEVERINQNPTQEEIGRLLFEVVSLARQNDIDPELALMETSKEFKQDRLAEKPE